METSSIGIPAVWEHALTNLLGHGPDSSIGINLRLWVIHQQFSNDLSEFCAWELHDFDLDTNALHRGAMTYLVHQHSTPSPFLQLLLPNQVKQLHGLWHYIVHQSMTGNPTIDGTVPSLQLDHWMATTITTFRRCFITFHRGLTNSTTVDISSASPATQRIPYPMPSISPATQRIPHPMPSISYPTSRVFHPTQSIQILPASIQVPVPSVAPSLPLDVFPTSLSQDGGEVSHTTGYADCPSINKSSDPSGTDACWDPSNTDADNKSSNIDEEKHDHIVELVSPHTSHHETCHFKTPDSIRSEYFEAYQQLQHIIANKHCNPDFTFTFDNIADNKNAASYNNENAAQLWGDSSYIETDAKIINLQTIADDDPTYDSSYYGEAIDSNDGKTINIGNWGINSTSAPITGETLSQGHDYGEPITIGNKLWGATCISNTTTHVCPSASHVFPSSTYRFLPVGPNYPPIDKPRGPPIIGNSNVFLSTKEDHEAHTPSMYYDIVDFKKKVVSSCLEDTSCLEHTSHSNTSYTKPWTNTNTTSSPNTLSDEGSTNSTLSSQYGEINDTNPIIIGNNLWGVTTTPTSILDEAYHQKHDYEETVTIGNNLWGEINLNLLSGSILIGNKLWGENLSLLTCTTNM
ncbi:hypothetical protein ACA910_013048 [Epithemia clementina (nom. ined.)]